MTDDKFLVLKMHPCAEGLSDEVVREISEKCELVKCDSGTILHRANEPIKSVYFLIHGRIKQSLIDIRGNVSMERQLVAGAQIGALAAASGEPTPIQVEVMEPTTVLILEYQMLLTLTGKHDAFLQNMSRIIAESVHSTLMGDRRKPLPSLISIVHPTAATRVIASRLVERLVTLGQRPFLIHDRIDWQPMVDIAQCCIIQNGRNISEMEIREKLDERPDHRPIVFDFDPKTDFQKTLTSVQVSEKVFWCVTPDNWKASVAQLAEIEKRAPSWRDKVCIVWLLPGDEPWAPYAPDLQSLANRSIKLSFDEPTKLQNRVLLNGFERLVHEVRGIRIGLALGGGAARGMAHLGVLKVLEENGICIDMIAGTSAGAMTGILYASGMNPEYSVECFVKDLRPAWLFRKMPNGGAWHLLLKYRRGQFDPLLRKYLKDSRLEQLPMPVHSVTVDLISGKPVIRDSGDSVHSILESINIPVLSKPINRDGRALVDGGIVNNVPANTLVAKGCNFVIAVSVTSKIKSEFASNRPDTPTSQMKGASVLATIMRTYVVQNVNMNSVGVQPADFVIQPNMSEFNSTEFSRADEMASIGKETAIQSMPELKSLLSRIDDKLFVKE
jgi:NTE family protein